MKPGNEKPSGRHVIIGTAGHIDHGKTALVKALTGIDTDRLKEEKERGMTTDLGFAFLGDSMTIIDVPGHEKFVKTMVAGVNTVDLALLVIAADDGIMPQTIEHLEILNLLRIPAGLVVVNKIDLVQKDWLDLVTEDVRKLLKGTILEQSPILPVSALSGQGIDDLRSAIFGMAEKVRNRQDKGVFRLPIDRVFTIKGFGTVVAGTVLSGKVAVEDTVELLPQGIPLRIRGIQVHDRPVKESIVGFRTALNVLGAEKESMERGHVLAEPGFFKPTSIVNSHFTLLSSTKNVLKNRTRIHFHIGASEVIARAVPLDTKTIPPGESGFVQFHFETPVVADLGDRFVVRSYSPVRTIGGGTILEAHPSKHKPLQPEIVDKLSRIHRGDPSQVVCEHLDRLRFIPGTSNDLAKALGLTIETVSGHLADLEGRQDALRVGKDRWMGRKNADIFKESLIRIVRLFHEKNPLRTGISRAEIRSAIRQPVDPLVLEWALGELENDGVLVKTGDRIRVKDFHASLDTEGEKIRSRIESLLLEQPFSPPDTAELAAKLGKECEAILPFLIESGTVVRVEEGIVFHRKALDLAVERIRSFLGQKGQATVSDIRQHLGTTRKYAVPLLIHLDTLGVTEREGDVRRLRE